MPREQRLYAIQRPDGSWWTEPLGHYSPIALFRSKASAKNVLNSWRSWGEEYKAAGWRIVEVEIREVEHDH